jgi:hypothetical protein
LIERYEPKKPRPEDTDTVLAGPPKADDLTAPLSRSPVVPRELKSIFGPQGTNNLRWDVMAGGFIVNRCILVS